MANSNTGMVLAIFSGGGGVKNSLKIVPHRPTNSAFSSTSPFFRPSSFALTSHEFLPVTHQTHNVIQGRVWPGDGERSIRGVS